jgi:hypothetical protein
VERQQQIRKLNILDIMKTHQKGFIIPFVIVLVAIVAAGSGVYYFNKNKPRVKDNPSISTLPVTTSDDFTTYDSEAGFSISYPKAWKAEAIKAEGVTYGGVKLVSSKQANTLEQMLTIKTSVAATPMTFQEMRNTIKKSYEVGNTYSPIKMTADKDIKIDGIDAYEAIYTETIKDVSTKNIKVISLAVPTAVQKGNKQELKTFIEIEYSAQRDAFDQALAEKIIGTFKQHVLKTQGTKTTTTAPIKEKQDTKFAEVQVRATLNNLRAAFEDIYDKNNNSYEGICSNGKINVAADLNIKSGVEYMRPALKTLGQSDTSIKCYASQTKYALSIKTSEEKTWCIDSTGFNSNGVADKITMSCK